MAEVQDQYERYYSEKISALIPEVYRDLDGRGQNPDVLKHLVEVIAAQAAITRRSIDRLWEDQHIETCDDWAVPYIGDLVATRPLSELDPRGRRVDVARTVHFRRRRGTPSLLETLVRELSGWDVVFVEAFRQLLRSPHRLDLFPVPTGAVTRTPRGGTANLTSPRSSQLAGSLNEFFHTPDVRQLRGPDGQINIPKLNFHLYRFRAYEVETATPVQMTDPGPVTFMVDPSGRDIVMFARGLPVTTSSLRACGDPWAELPTPEATADLETPCVKRCTGTREWEVTRPMPVRMFTQAAYQLDLETALQAVQDADQENQGLLRASVDLLNLENALRILVGFRFDSEAQLREKLTQLGISFSPMPVWYRLLLRRAVTSDSAKPALVPPSVPSENSTESVGINFGAGGSAPFFDETTGANLASRIRHPVPSDPGVVLLVHPELGRFTYPQAAPPIGTMPDESPESPEEPGEVDIGDVILFARSGVLTIKNFTQTLDETQTGFSTVVSCGNQLTLVDTDSHLGDLWSIPPVDLRDRVVIHGSARSASTITQGNGGAIEGDLQEQTDIAPALESLLEALNFDVSYPPVGPNTFVGSPTVLPPHQPGDSTRGEVLVQGEGASLELSSGEYFFERFTVQSGTALRVNSSGGKVYVYVRTTVVFRGALDLLGGDPSDFILVCTQVASVGTTVELDAIDNYRGIVLVPNALLHLKQVGTFEGAYWAASVLVEPNQTFILNPWDGALPPSATSLSLAARSVETPPAGFEEISSRGVDQQDPLQVVIPLPLGVTIDQVMLHADGGTLQLDTDTQVLDLSGGGGIVALNDVAVGDALSIGDRGSVGNVWTDLPITVGDNAHIRGDLVTSDASITVGTGTVVEGDQLPNSTLQPFGEFYGPVAPGFTGDNDQTIFDVRVLSAGQYGNYVVEDGGTLILTEGVYTFTSFSLLAGATLKLDATASIQVFVQDELTWEGTQMFVWGRSDLFELVCYGAADVTLNSPFSGTLYVPNTSLTLSADAGSHFMGAFFAQSLSVGPGVSVLAFAPTPEVERYFYGFPGDVGAGAYSRDLPKPAEPDPNPPDGILDGLPQVGPLTLKDSRTYRLPITSSRPITDTSLQSLPTSRPYIRVQADEESSPTVAAELVPTDPATPDEGEPRSIAFDGVWLGSLLDEVSDFVIARAANPATSDFDWEQVVIKHSTFDPGGKRADNTDIAALRIFVTGRVKRLVIERSIMGPVFVQCDGDTPGLVETIEIRDSIIDGQHGAPQNGRQVAVLAPTSNVVMNGVTVFGDVHADLLTANDCIVMGRLVVANSQASCFRFSAASLHDADLPDTAEDHLPKLFEVPTIDEVFPYFFTSLRYGDPGYGQLSQAAPESVQRGAQNTSEMGVFSYLYRPIKLGSIQAKVDEFKPIGAFPQYILEGESARIPEPAEPAE